MRQIALRSNTHSSLSEPDLGSALGVLHESFTTAVIEASKRLSEMGVRHVLCGGVAVGAYSEPRATKDVDFLVGDEAFEISGGILSLRAGLPLRVGKVDVDLIPLPENCPFDLPEQSTSQIPVIPVEALAFLKLRANRLRDRADVARLIETGHGLVIKQWIRVHAPGLLDRLEDIAKQEP